MSRVGRVIVATATIDRILRGVGLVRDEVALATIDPGAWRDIGARLYARSAQFRPGSDHNRGGLWEWEIDAIRRHFPPAPARILVAGCGGGREVCSLLERGYVVPLAYDPVEAFVTSLRATLARCGEHELAVASHEDVASGVVRLPPFDAALVGWTSYSHVPDPQMRRRFLRRLRERAPQAPVLLSFLGPPPDPAAREERLRATVRAALGRFPWSHATAPGDRFESRAGFVHYFTEDELVAEAADAGYRAVCYSDLRTALCPHAVLVPDTGRASAKDAEPA